MAPFLNAKGQPVKMSFFDLFGPTTPSRSGKGIPRGERKKTEESSPTTETSPQSTAATEALTEPTVITAWEYPEWTRIEELALLGMKAQDMSWKEIGEALPGKDTEDIKKKYRELYVDAPANVKPKEGDGNQEGKKDEKRDETNPDEAKAAEGSKTEKAEGKKVGKEWKKGQKSSKAQKGKGKAVEAKPEEVKPEEDRQEKPKGILKAKATAEEKGKGGELKSIHGHPVIFVADNEELDFDELLYLYGLHARYDELKWITVDSKFFDRFGKRIGTQKLKEKLAGIS